MPPRPNAGNAHAAREIAIGKAHPRAAEAARVDLLDTKTRLQRDSLKPHRKRRPPSPPRPPYRAPRPRAAHLDGPDHRTVGVNAPRPARAVEAVEREKLAGDEAPRLLRAQHFRPRRDGCKQRHEHNCEPRNHIPSPVTAAPPPRRP